MAFTVTTLDRAPPGFDNTIGGESIIDGDDRLPSSYTHNPQETIAIIEFQNKILLTCFHGLIKVERCGYLAPGAELTPL